MMEWKRLNVMLFDDTLFERLRLKSRRNISVTKKPIEEGIAEK